MRALPAARFDAINDVSCCVRKKKMNSIGGAFSREMRCNGLLLLSLKRVQLEYDKGAISPLHLVLNGVHLKRVGLHLAANALSHVRVHLSVTWAMLRRHTHIQSAPFH